MAENKMSFDEILDEISNKKMLLIKTLIDKDVTGFDALRESVIKRIDTYRDQNKTFNNTMSTLLNVTYNDFIKEEDVISLITMKQLVLGKQVVEKENPELVENLKNVEELLVERLAEEIKLLFDDVIVEAKNPERVGDGSYDGRTFKELWTLQKKFVSLVKLSEAFGFDVKAELEKMDKAYVYGFATTGHLTGENYAKYNADLKKEQFYSLAKTIHKNKK